MKNKSTLVSILSLSFTIFLFIILKIVDNIFGDGIPLSLFCIASLIITFLVTVFFVSVTFLIAKINDILDHKYKETSYPLSEKCKFEERICCANLVLEELQGDYELILEQEIADKYNLFTEKQILDLEDAFSKGEIWIFSYDLTTEVLEDKASKMVKENLKKGVIYREFYIADTKEVIGNATANRKKMEKWYNGVRNHDGNEYLWFYPYNNPDSMLNYLFALFGIVLYIEDPDNPDSIQAYFSLRATNSVEKKPIYVKMPNCMKNKYHRLLNNIITHHI